MDLDVAKVMVALVKDMDKPIGRLMEKAARGGAKDADLLDISGELLGRQFMILELLSNCFPDLDTEGNP